MAEETAEYRVLKGQIDRQLELSSVLLEKLRTGGALSAILSDVALLAKLRNDYKLEVLVSFMNYGRFSGSSLHPQTQDHRWEEADLVYQQMFAQADAKQFALDTPASRRGSLQRPLIGTASIFSLEQAKPPTGPWPPSYYQTDEEWAKQENLFDQREFTYSEGQRVLNNARSYVHRWVADVWEDANKKLEALELLGPDYRFVLDSLSALDTKVGNMLRAVVSQLRSDNPAQWQLAAQGCRSCIIELSDLLWKSDVPSYQSYLDAKVLDLKRDREKNKLYAYIDAKYEVASDEDKEKLKTVHDLVHPIYEQGSKAKRLMSMAEARAVVRNAFRLCHLLYEATSFEPVTDADIAHQG